MIDKIDYISNVEAASELLSFPNQDIIWEITNNRKTGEAFALSRYICDHRKLFQAICIYVWP